MALTPEQLEQVKAQLREQVQQLPEDKKAQAFAQIEQMSPEAIESMVQQSRQQNQQIADQNQKSIYRMIVDKDVPSVQIDENSSAIAVMDITPISQGHSIIIPRKPCKSTKELPVTAFSLAKNLAKRMTSKLKAKSNIIQTEVKFGEAIINVLPIYDSDVHLGSPRSKVNVEELEKIAPKLRVVKKKRIPTVKIPSTSQKDQTDLIKIKRRIP